MNGVTVEICVDSVESAVAAQTGGAQRVELCDNLMEGGTTPSFGAIEVARRLLTIRLHVIIRPRGGDFLYSATEFEIMKRDIEAAKGLGVHGVVIGLLNRDGNIDVLRTTELVKISRPMSVTVHRAFDVCHDPFLAVDQLAEVGVDRILTSGQEATAVEGSELIAKLVNHSGDRIIIMACGNLNQRNIHRVVAETGVKELHFTGFHSVESEMQYRNERVFMGGTLRPPEYSRAVADADTIRNAIAAI